MKRTLYLSMALFLFGTACRTPIVVDENGWPIGFATRRATQDQTERVPQQGMQAEGAPVQGLDGARPEIANGPGADVTADVDPHRVAAEPAAERSQPLYGWNGEVVQGSAGADDRPTQSPPRHGIGPESGGRMRIIELYQTVLDERDALRDEMETLTAALEGAQRNLIELEEQTQTMQQRILELEDAAQTMQAENIDLAGRLTTAQIRRLEAEKLLLENRIGVLRQSSPEEGTDARSPRNANAPRQPQRGSGS